MTQFFKRHFLSITLISLTCLSIFANDVKNAPDSQNVSENNSLIQLQEEAQAAYEQEIFQSCMSQARAQMQSVGFCLQQLLQTIEAQKIPLTKEQKLAVTQEIVVIQNFTKVLLEKLFVLNSKDTLFEVIIINNVLIDYLLSVIKNDITQIEASKIHECLFKKAKQDLSPEVLFALAEKNQENIAKLINATDNVGLRWYNHAYRGIQKYNPTLIAKGALITAASVFVLGYTAAMFEEWLPDSVIENSMYKKFVGPRTRFASGTKDTYKIPAPGEQTTPIQKMSITLDTLQNKGILSIGTLIALSYKDVLSTLYNEPLSWLKTKSTKKLDDINKVLLGTAKPNVSHDGQEKVYFKDMVGSEHLEELAKKIANFMKHPERYERTQLEEHRGILLFGPPQTGKTLFAKALRTLIAEELGDEKKVSFIDAKKILDSTNFTIEDIFAHAAYYSPCIIFFDEIDLVGAHRDKNSWSTSQLLTCMQGIDGALKQVFVIGATNRPEQLDFALKKDGRFGKTIYLEYPKYEHRKIFLQQQLAKRSVSLSPEYVDCIAQETDGCSYNELKRIITEALIQSSIEMRAVCQKDLEKALDTEIRKMQQSNTMSDEEKRIVATYQAGKAVARHILKTNQEVVKVTVNAVNKELKTDVPFTVKTSTDVATAENENLVSTKKDTRVKLGEVFTKSKANHSELLSDEEQRKECLALLAGNATLQLMLNKSYTSCNKHDRADVMQIIYSMISNGEKIDEKVKNQAIALKDQYEKEIAQMLELHKDLIQKVIDMLMNQNTIDRYEWKALVG
ncbi:MAG TPA: AAA family ATPase [Candidatus Saccharimonadales bacterium]|nr:AAA family ATPase [Candidatus Saccharimonadales bacterium]